MYKSNYQTKINLYETDYYFHYNCFNYNASLSLLIVKKRSIKNE